MAVMLVKLFRALDSIKQEEEDDAADVVRALKQHAGQTLWSAGCTSSPQCSPGVCVSWFWDTVATSSLEYAEDFCNCRHNILGFKCSLTVLQKSPLYN